MRPTLRLFFVLIYAIGLLACGAGTTVSNGSLAPGSSASGQPPGPTKSPGQTATPVSAGSSTPAAPTSTPSGQSSGSPQNGPLPPPTAPPDAIGFVNMVPSVPAGSACRAGTNYSIYVTSGPTDISRSGTLEVFTVYEPATLCGNKTYPVILNAPGFGQTRQASAVTASEGTYTAAGYGFVAMDEAGTGEDGGFVRVMDPDQEGVMLLSVLNWVQAKLSWIAYAPTLDGSDPHEPVYGADGGSYGGMYQYMLLNIDKRHRIRAMAPQISPADLNFSLFQNGVLKTYWLYQTFMSGETGDGRIDPFVGEELVKDSVTNMEDSQAHDFFGYHSSDYFCNDTTFATNGNATNPGNVPQLPPTSTTPRVNALIYIGVRDTLFNFNNGYMNLKCLSRAGGDVRLLSYQTGHNALSKIPDPYVLIYYPPGDELDNRCGSQLTQSVAELAWFNQYLKGIANAAAAVPSEPCISLSDGDGVTVPNVPEFSDPATSAEYTTFPVSLTLTSGLIDTTVTQVLYTTSAAGALELGIPHINLALSEVTPMANSNPFAFVGLCVEHASLPGIDLVDNEVAPLRGVGTFNLDIIGGGIRLKAGDKLEFCAQGLNEQYAANGSLNVQSPTFEQITLKGVVSVAILPSQPTI